MITCTFKCYGCRSGEVGFQVRSRARKEPVVTWIKFAVSPAMAEAHRLFAPWCKSTAADLKIPMGDRIGDIPKPLKH